MDNHYLGQTSQRMHETMQTLTVFASIFMPLTFIAGIYEMNFDYMPELHWEWGYLATWAVMILMSISIFTYFKAKKLI